MPTKAELEQKIETLEAKINELNEAITTAAKSNAAQMATTEKIIDEKSAVEAELLDANAKIIALEAAASAEAEEAEPLPIGDCKCKLCNAVREHGKEINSSRMSIDELIAKGV